MLFDQRYKFRTVSINTVCHEVFNRNLVLFDDIVNHAGSKLGLGFKLKIDREFALPPSLFVFIDQGQYPERPAIVSSVSHKIKRPDMVFDQGLQTDAGSVIEP